MFFVLGIPYDLDCLHSAAQEPWGAVLQNCSGDRVSLWPSIKFCNALVGGEFLNSDRSERDFKKILVKEIVISNRLDTISNYLLLTDLSVLLGFQ
jgi:hypothetical protein